MTRHVLLSTLLAGALAACHPDRAGEGPLPGAPVFTVIQGVTELPADVHSPHPIAVSLVAAGVQSRPEGLRTALELRLERRSDWQLPVRARLVPPPGVSVEGGYAGFTFPQAPMGTTQVATIMLRSRGVPPQDLRVDYESVEGESGIRGHADYRFGRPEPQSPPLELSAHPVTLHGIPTSTPVILR